MVYHVGLVAVVVEGAVLFKTFLAGTFLHFHWLGVALRQDFLVVGLDDLFYIFGAGIRDFYRVSI